MRVDGKWVPTFPNARYLFGKTEFEHWSAEGDDETQVILSDSVQPILDAGLAEFVGLDYRISPNVRLTPSTGHTPGHVCVVLESDGQSAVITGDMTHHPASWRTRNGRRPSTATLRQPPRRGRGCFRSGRTSRCW